MAKGGASHPVHIIESSDLKQNGGNYRLRAGPAVKVYGSSDPGKIVQGKLQAVYVVPDGFPMQGGKPMPITNVIEVADRGLRGGLIATPVYVVNSDEWPITYFIRDEFTDTRAAGVVDGTAATPGPGVRKITDDTDETISIDGGVMAWDRWTTINPMLSYENSGGNPIAITRSPGVTMHYRFRQFTVGNYQCYFTFHTASTKPGSDAGDAQMRTQGAGRPVRFTTDGNHNTDLAHSLAASSVFGEYAIVLKSAGAQLWWSNSGSWEKIADWDEGNNSPLYASWTNHLSVASDGELDFIRVTSRPPEGIPVPS